MVVSALGGVTDLLLKQQHWLQQVMKLIKEKLRLVEHRHLETVKQLIPVAQQSQMLSLVKKSCNEMEDICNGIFLLR